MKERLDLDASFEDVLLLVDAAVEQLEAVEVGPGVAQVGVDLDAALEPLAALLRLALGPHEARHGQQHVRVVLAPVRVQKNTNNENVIIIHSTRARPNVPKSTRSANTISSGLAKHLAIPEAWGVRLG